eukprot:361692-Chlamydomonas_euryale.AAC.1
MCAGPCAQIIVFRSTSPDPRPQIHVPRSTSPDPRAQIIVFRSTCPDPRAQVHVPRSTSRHAQAQKPAHSALASCQPQQPKKHDRNSPCAAARGAGRQQEGGHRHKCNTNL